MNTQWFLPDGHLTDQALALLSGEETPPALQRLEAAEHLAFCVPCMERYLQMLDAAPLPAPPADLGRAVAGAVARKKRVLFLRPVLKAAACAGLALTLWLAGHGPHGGGPLLADIPHNGPASTSISAPAPLTGPLDTPLLNTLSKWSSDIADQARQAAETVSQPFDTKMPPDATGAGRAEGE